MSSISEALGGLPQQFVVVESSPQPTTTGQEVQLCSPNPLRWALLLGPTGNDTTSAADFSWASTVRGRAAQNEGIPFGNNIGPLLMTFRDYGILVQQSWYGASPSANANEPFCVIEVLIQQ